MLDGEVDKGMADSSPVSFLRVILVPVSVVGELYIEIEALGIGYVKFQIR